MSHRPVPNTYAVPVKQFTLPAVSAPLVDHRHMDAEVAAGGFIVYDAVDYNAIPANATHLMGYLDGAWPNYGALRTRFPTATILDITVTGKYHADIGDNESGDLVPATTASLLKSGAIRAGYSSDADYPAILRACGQAFPWWAANPTGVPHQDPRSVATQFAWPGYGSPGNYDISLTDGVFFGWTRPAPTPPPAPTPAPPHKESTMICTVPTGGILAARPDGSVDAFEGANYFGSMSGHPLAAPVVGIASTPTGHGYWLLGADGGIFNFGDAKYCGPGPQHRGLWNIGVGRAIPLIGIATGQRAGVAYTLAGDNGGPAVDLYDVLADGSYVP